MNPGANRVGRKTTRASDIVVPESCNFAHQEHVAIDIGQRGERLVHGKIDILRRQPYTRVVFGLHLPQALTVVIQREISRDAEQPRTQFSVRGHRYRCAGNSQKDVLRQIARCVGLAHCSAKVPEQPVPVGCEERFSVDHSASHY
jgi:hypothetical protein